MSSRKNLALTLILLLILSSLIIVGTVYAQSIPKPSVPQFTVKFVDLSYDVPTTTSIDQYTGQTITYQEYHVENRTIQITIENQPFTSYIENGQKISFYLNVRVKGHYAENWTSTISSPENWKPVESNTKFTKVVYLIDANDPPFWNDLVNGGTVDIQAVAMIGYVSRTVGFASWYFAGQTSDWSPTQTVTIPASNTASPSPTVAPSVPEFPATLTIAFLLITALAVAIVSRRKHLTES
jgi:hypothetical protein